MSARALIAKDVRQHVLAISLLAVFMVGITLIFVLQSRSAALSISVLQVLHTTLLSALPLFALIIGNRLIVRENLNRTRQFVEALPVARYLPVVIQYGLGLAGLFSLGALMFSVVLLATSPGDAVDLPLITLLSGKTLAFLFLLWSVVFCGSQCGHWRLLFYAVILGGIWLLIGTAPIENDQFAPFALMNRDLFAFERDEVPWRALVGTVGVGLLFSLAGFALAWVGRRSVAESLARPIGPRDYMAAGLLLLAATVLWQAQRFIVKPVPQTFSGDSIIVYHDPTLAVSFPGQNARARSEAIAQGLHQSLRALVNEFNLAWIPETRLTLDRFLRRNERQIELGYEQMVITANYLDHDEFDEASLRALAVHELLTRLSSGRSLFEPYHWVADGFSRWLVESAAEAGASVAAAHHVELLARAILALDELSARRSASLESFDMMRDWEICLDHQSDAGCEAIAYSAMVFLVQTRGRDAVLDLVSEFSLRSVHSHSAAALADRQPGADLRFESATGVAWGIFSAEWRRWLDSLPAIVPGLYALLEAAPQVQVAVTSQIDAAGTQRLTAGYTAVAGRKLAAGAKCVLWHGGVSPFDVPVSKHDLERDEADCQPGSVTHTVDSRYARGDRIFVAFEVDVQEFHEPFRVWSDRINVQ